jgi:hypothetical protein
MSRELGQEVSPRRADHRRGDACGVWRRRDDDAQRDERRHRFPNAVRDVDSHSGSRHHTRRNNG